jgi:hypothetical protein
MKDDGAEVGVLLKKIIDALEAHYNSIVELYENQRNLKRSLDELDKLNRKLVDALLRNDNMRMQ